MAKKKAPVSGVKTYIYRATLVFLGASLVLFVSVVFISGRYFGAKLIAEDLIANTQSLQEQGRDKEGVETSAVLASTIVTVPAGYPLFVQKKQLQDYTVNISKLTGRDFIVADKNGVILADNNPGKVGASYAGDSGKEVMQTLSDGLVRHFVEMNKDNSQGISETVSPVRDESGNIIGAVILSASPAFK